MTLTAAEQVEQLEHVLELMDECAEVLRSLDDARVEAYCLADFEGSSRGWLGHFVRDVIEEHLTALREQLT